MRVAAAGMDSPPESRDGAETPPDPFDEHKDDIQAMIDDYTNKDIVQELLHARPAQNQLKGCPGGSSGRCRRKCCRVRCSGRVRQAQTVQLKVVIGGQIVVTSS